MVKYRLYQCLRSFDHFKFWISKKNSKTIEQMFRILNVLIRLYMVVALDFSMGLNLTLRKASIQPTRFGRVWSRRKKTQYMYKTQMGTLTPLARLVSCPMDAMQGYFQNTWLACTGRNWARCRAGCSQPRLLRATYSTLLFLPVHRTRGCRRPKVRCLPYVQQDPHVSDEEFFSLVRIFVVRRAACRAFEDLLGWLASHSHPIKKRTLPTQRRHMHPAPASSSWKT